MNERIVVITGAAALDRNVVEMIPDAAIILAVDGGLDHALAAGLVPSGLIGDLDSVSPDGLAWAEQHATISRHPADKERTDTELALTFAADMVPSGITLIGDGDRLDHTIGAIGALGASDLTSVPELDAWWGGQHLTVLHGPGQATLQLRPGSALSLLALHGRCDNVRIDGVRWPLDGTALEPANGLGISNEVLADGDGRVEVHVSSGVLTMFDHPAPASSIDVSSTDVSPTKKDH